MWLICASKLNGINNSLKWLLKANELFQANYYRERANFIFKWFPFIVKASVYVYALYCARMCVLMRLISVMLKSWIRSHANRIKCKSAFSNLCLSRSNSRAPEIVKHLRCERSSPFENSNRKTQNNRSVNWFGKFLLNQIGFNCVRTRTYSIQHTAVIRRKAINMDKQRRFDTMIKEEEDKKNEEKISFNHDNDIFFSLIVYVCIGGIVLCESHMCGWREVEFILSERWSHIIQRITYSP